MPQYIQASDLSFMVKTALDLTPEEFRRYNPAKQVETKSADEHGRKLGNWYRN